MHDLYFILYHIPPPMSTKCGAILKKNFKKLIFSWNRKMYIFISDFFHIRKDEEFLLAD